jgi:hypothetical protein
LQVSFISVYLPQEVKAAEDLKLTVTRSSSKKMASKVRLSSIQCCGSGSGIRIRIIFPSAWKQVLGLKYLYSLMRIRDGKIQIRDGNIWDPG